ncbi:MAG: hypothetical protein Q9221_005178 [Calogaya cf. arnoldii]
MRGTLHTEFETITIHTAKCDLCNAHNQSTMYRCTKCGRHCCKTCWDSKGGDGRHWVHDRQKLTYTGPKAEPLPPLEAPKTELKVAGGKEGERGKVEVKKGADKKDGVTKKERKKSLIVKLDTGKGKKRARDDDESFDKDEYPTPPTTAEGYPEGSAAAENKRRRLAAASNFAEKSKQSNTPRKAAAIKPSTTTTNPISKPKSKPKSKQTAHLPWTKAPSIPIAPKPSTAPSTPAKANHAPLVPSSSTSPTTRKLTQPALPQHQRSYNLDTATATLLSFSGEVLSSPYSDSEDEESHSDSDSHHDEHPPYVPITRAFTAVNNHHATATNNNINISHHNHKANSMEKATHTPTSPKDHQGMHSLLFAAEQLEKRHTSSSGTSPLRIPNINVHGNAGVEAENAKRRRQLARLGEASPSP